ncbi:MAG: hypothetical protein HOF02_01245 [Gammaproteobacteria bacterium]|jgi:hypothetical protein|nr:hypothetical protein [Gammaproteobacteria bacterium]MBT7753463.1 hypothetical protein [Gammaproteobacteria bacterium]
MNNRIKKFYQILLVLPILSGCSFFESAVLTCNEPQEYEQSTSIQNLVVPDNLRELQKRSRFNIPELEMNQSVIAEDNVIGEMLPMTINEKNETTVDNIDDDDLSELLGLIDKTIDNRDITSNKAMVYKEVSQDSNNKQLQPCLDEAPNYFADGILQKTLPTQNYERKSKTGQKKKRSFWQRITGRNKDSEKS